MGIKLSHPRVVTTSLDFHNQTLKLEAGASGESTVMIYLKEDPKIYDVFTVHVASMLQPSSPVMVHPGAKVNFKLIDDHGRFIDVKHLEPVWSSSNISVVDIDSKNGEANAYSHGDAMVKLTNSMQAQSIVRVRSIDRVDVQQSNLIINTDDNYGYATERVKLSLYLEGQRDEVEPQIERDGIVLIK